MCLLPVSCHHVTPSAASHHGGPPPQEHQSWRMSSYPCHPCAPVSWMYSQTHSILCLHWTMHQLCPGIDIRHVRPVLSWYYQVSGSKIWQTERSCMCCQEMGEKEATVALFCPKAAYDEPKVRKVHTNLSPSSKYILKYFQLVTRAPAGCMCRPCTAVEVNIISMLSHL